MIKPKELLDGLVDDLLELPAMWLRTHLTLLRYGSQGPAVLAESLKSESATHLRARTAAFIDMLLVVVVFKIENLHEGTLGENFLATLLGFQNALTDSALLNSIVLFAVFYYAYYPVALAVRSAESRRASLGAAIFYVTLTYAVFMLAWIFAFGRQLLPDLYMNEALVAVVSYGFAAWCFWRLASILRLNLGANARFVPPWAEMPMLFAVLLGTYLLILALLFGPEALWPDLGV